MSYSVGYKMRLRKGEFNETEIEIYLDGLGFMAIKISVDESFEVCSFDKEEANEFIDKFVNLTGFMEDEK